MYGGEQPDAKAAAGAETLLQHPFSGALEEIHLQRLSLENVSAALWPGGPGQGPTNYYMYDYSQPQARDYWANKTATLINHVGAIAGQWDGAEFQPCAALWDIPHSNRTFESGLWLAKYGGVRFYSNGLGPGHLQWPTYTLAAFDQSRRLWKKSMATEFSLTFGGLGPWRGDMTPLGDEGATIAEQGVCRAGSGMVLQILKYTVAKGLLYNAYDTNLTPLNVSEVDCFIGQMVAVGIAPQLTGKSTQAVATRVRYWLDIMKAHGMANESSIHPLPPDRMQFLVQLVGGSEDAGLGKKFGLRYEQLNHTTLPPIVPNNSTIILSVGFAASGTASFEISERLGALSVFAASAATMNVSGGPFAQSRRVLEQITTAGGHTRVAILNASTPWRHLSVVVGDRVRWSLYDTG
eukprot:SAG31_NODE_876_length_11307_cov_3.506781_12_plen_407_part_00